MPTLSSEPEAVPHNCFGFAPVPDRHLVACLYVRRHTPYRRLPICDCWDVTRDARLYAGTLPVIAHPPCATWGRCKNWAKQDTSDCGLHAVATVRLLGGVVEQPADSSLWKATGARDGDLWGGRMYRVLQWHWGHRALKATDLYAVRLGEPPPYPCRPIKDPIPVLKMWRGERERTPAAFANHLVSWVLGGVS
jgi:hypothetical protein